MTADPRAFRDVMGRFATGVAVVTARGPDGAPAGLTTNAVSSVSLDPPLVLACFDNASRTLAAVRTSGRFAVNVLAAGQDHLAARFATKADDKFDGLAFREFIGLPVFADALAWVACAVEALHPGGDHAIGVGRVLAMGGRDGEPLVFFRGEYRAVA